MIIKENDLSAKERKLLPIDEFGLPEERKYPMSDEEHVRKAVQFFGFCPKEKKKELAKNINRLAKKYNMRMKLDKHSLFYKYADKSIVQESGFESAFGFTHKDDSLFYLKDSDFGIPEIRAFPLTNEFEIKQAVAFFEFCPNEKRIELAKNINEKAKKLGIKISIEKESSFYRFANINLIEKSEPIFESIEKSEEIIYPQNIQSILNTIQNKVIKSDIDLFQFEVLINDKLLPELTTIFKKEIFEGKHYKNPVEIVNNIMEKKYTLYNNYRVNILGENVFNNDTVLFYELLKDLKYIIVQSMYNFAECESAISILNDLIMNFNCNHFIIRRYVMEILFSCFSYEIELSNCPYDYTNNLFDIEKIETQLNKILEKLNDLSITMNHLSFHNISQKQDIGNDNIKKIISTTDLNLVNVENFLNNLKFELNNQVQKVILLNNFPIISRLSDDKTFFLNDLLKNKVSFFNVIDALEGYIKPENLKLYNKDYSYILDSRDLVIISGLKSIIRNIYPSKDKNNDTFYYAVTDKKQLCLITKNLENRYEYNLIILCEPGFDYFLFGYGHKKDTKFPNIRVRKIILNDKTPPDDFTKVTEGIEVTPNGGIKFVLNPKKSFMDEYAENHKLLVENFKNKNFDGMKTNLAFAFALINYIERIIVHSDKRKIKEDKQKDAEKARMFLINDFKTYLKEVQRIEPTFDFTKYYTESDYGKLVLHVSNDTLVGIKKIFKTILLTP